MHPRLDKLDLALTRWLRRWGHCAHRHGLAWFFVWLGLLKLFGYTSATTLIAHTVYFATPEVMVPVLGIWEVLIGVCLAWRPLIRAALLLLAVRLPGTALALVLKADVCFVNAPLVPTIEGQYLIKDMILFAAAMVIGGTVRDEDPPR